MKNSRLRLKAAIIVIICTLLSATSWALLKYRDSSRKSLVPVSDSVENSSNLSVDQMREDLDYMVKVIEQTHPSTVNGFNENQMKLIQEAYGKITKSINPNDFYFIINEIIASINDGHTTLSYKTGNGYGIIRLPFRWLKEGMIVSVNADQLIIGDKILSIGGKTEKQLYEEMDKLIPGENEYWIKIRAQTELQTEPVLRHLNLVNKENNVDFEIDRNGTKVKISLPIEFSSKAAGGQPVEWIKWDIEKENSLGILYLDQCKNDDKYKQALNDFFKAIKQNNIKNIALDLRKNAGGSSSVIDTFIQYLNVDTYRGMGSEVRISQSYKDQLDSKLPVGHYKYDSKLIANKKNVDKDLIYRGNIYVLTSSRTFSAANLFALALKDNGIAKILGEPTGNATTRYGEVLSFTLPNSKFKLGVACKLFSRPDSSAQWQDAVYPDIEIYTTRDDIINGKDPQLERLRMECEKNK